MPATKQERLEIERGVRDQFMRDLASGNFQIHGMKWDTIIAGIRNLDQLGSRSTMEKRIEEIVRLNESEARVAELKAALRQIIDAIGPIFNHPELAAAKDHALAVLGEGSQDTGMKPK